MKKEYIFPMLSISLALLFVIVGCQSVNKSLEYYKACKEDSECYEMMMRTGNITKSAVSSLPVGNNESLLGYIAGLLGSSLAGIIYGKRICKKKG